MSRPTPSRIEELLNFEAEQQVQIFIESLPKKFSLFRMKLITFLQI